MKRKKQQQDKPKKRPVGRPVERQMPDPIPGYNSPANKMLLYGQQGGYCAGCEHHFEERHLEVDHIIARAKGGTDHISNLQLLCGSCNRSKGDRSQEELLVRLTDKGWLKRKKEAA